MGSLLAHLPTLCWGPRAGPAWEVPSLVDSEGGGPSFIFLVSTQGTCLKLTPSSSPPLFVYSFQFSNHLLASPTGLSREIREWDCQ